MKPIKNEGNTNEETGSVRDKDRGSNADSRRTDSARSYSEINVERSASLRNQESFGSRRNSGSGRRNSGSWRKGSLSFSRGESSQILEDIQSESVAQAGDIGDRNFSGSRHSAASGSLQFELDDLRSIDNGLAVPDVALIRSNVTSPVSPLTSEIVTPLPTDPILRDLDRSRLDAPNQSEDSPENIPKSLLYISCIIHLALFGIMGVFARYFLKILCGLSNQSPFYPDLPSNMVGSFLMGWFGIVFKGDITHVSEFLAIGLTTGFLGSLTTFSGWNQSMLELSTKGKWAAAFGGILIGLVSADFSIITGFVTAKGFRWILTSSGSYSGKQWSVDSRNRHIIVLVIVLLVLCLLWVVSGELLRMELKKDDTQAQLWLACLVGPVGVWVRWRLARINGEGIGKRHLLKWVPFGTLIANVLAACVMAALATIKKAVNTRHCDIILSGIQLGFLGCLSTVSTFIAELFAMQRIKHHWRALVYATITIIPSFALGTLIYSLPVWIKGYE